MKGKGKTSSASSGHQEVFYTDRYSLLDEALRLVHLVLYRSIDYGGVMQLTSKARMVDRSEGERCGLLDTLFASRPASRPTSESGLIASAPQMFGGTEAITPAERLRRLEAFSAG